VARELSLVNPKCVKRTVVTPFFSSRSQRTRSPSHSPARPKPREHQHTGPLNLPILSGYGKRLVTHADAAHTPFAAGAQIRLHEFDLENSFGAPPPFQAVAGIRQRLKDSFGRSFYREFLNNPVVYTCRIH
jgi:hypothetical protein